MKFFLILFLSFLCGCATLTVETPQGWKIQYARFWDQELSNVYFDMETNGTVHAGLGSQKTEAQKTLEMLLHTLKGVK